jgi:hypothetical protein
VVPEVGQGTICGDVDVHGGLAPRPLDVVIRGGLLGLVPRALGEHLKVLDGLEDGAWYALPVLLLVPDDLVDKLVLLLRSGGGGGREVAGELREDGLVDF